MIKIEEKQTSKLPGITSLFVSFNYNASIVEAIKTLPNYTYDKKTFTWEIPITSLAKLLNLLNPIDDITLTLLPDKEEKKPKEITLSDFKTEPYYYQKEGIIHGLRNDRFLLLDQPGLGKSLQLIYLAEELKEREGLEHCLVICGINTLKANWKKEIEQHSKLDCRILGERVSKKGKYSIGSIKERLEDLKNPIKEFFIIVNIETLRNDDIVKAINNGPNKIDMIVVDEIHSCKSPSSQQGKNLLKVNKAKHLIGATGTLLLNNPVDAYVPLKWIGAERGTFTNFKYYYCNYTGQFNNILIGFRNLNILQDQIDKYSLRRTKDILDLPPKNIIHEIIEMEPAQAKFYNDLKEGIVKDVDLVDIKPSALLSMVTRLRQATSYPGILTSNTSIESSKINRAVDLAEQIVSNDEKVVIFSTFKPTLDVLAKKLEQHKPLLCTGDVKDSIVSANIEQFQTDPDCKIMLATVQKMSTGITLTAAKTEIVIDCAWTQAQNLQMEDRVHRIGSKEPVFIYYLWNNDSIDLRVKEIVESKEAIADFIVDGTCPPHLASKLKEIVQDLQNS